MKFIELFCKANLNRMSKESIPVSFKLIDGVWYCDILGWPEEYFSNTMMVTDAHTLLCQLSPEADYITLNVKIRNQAPEGATSLLEKIEYIALHGPRVGIYTVLTTSRVESDIISVLLRVETSCRIAFRTASAEESITIIYGPGATQLTGKGEMFFLRNYKLTRLQTIKVGE